MNNHTAEISPLLTARLAGFVTGVPIALLNKLNQFATLQLLGGANYLAIFTEEQLQALAYLFLPDSRGTPVR